MRVAFYVRVSTSDQTVENQLADLQMTAERLKWDVVAVYRDDGISGAKGREKRPGYDAMLKAITRGEIQMVAAWSVDRIGRSLHDLVNFMQELRDRGVDLYLHKQSLDTSSTTGRAMFGMLSIFSEMERSILSERVRTSLNRLKSEGRKLGRPPTNPAKVERAKELLAAGTGIRETARKVKISTGLVQRLKKELGADAIGQTPS
ncbi:recombinase family protein [Paramagnetospirillum caucaseum]|nr:recombinase family protein [Paramagnetospirillum caucaseum]